MIQDICFREDLRVEPPSTAESAKFKMQQSLAEEIVHLLDASLEPRPLWRAVHVYLQSVPKLCAICTVRTQLLPAPSHDSC